MKQTDKFEGATGSVLVKVTAARGILFNRPTEIAAKFLLAARFEAVGNDIATSTTCHRRCPLILA